MEEGVPYSHASPTHQPSPLSAVSKVEWSSPLQVVKYPHPKLRALNAKVGVFDDSLIALAKEMIKIMYQ